MNNLLRTGYSVGLALILAVGASADDREALKPLAEKTLKAAGGDRMQKIRAWSMTTKRTETVGGRVEPSRSGVLRLYVQLPDRYRLEFESNAWVDDARDRTIVVVNGQKGWRYGSVTGQTKELSAEEIAACRASIQLPTWIRGAARLNDPRSRLVRLPETKIADRLAVGVRLTHKEYPSVRLYFDKDKGLLLRSERNQNDDTSLERTSEVTYSDFRRVNGILVPHKHTYKAEGTSRREVQVEGIGTLKVESNASPVHRLDELSDWKVAEKLDPQLFEKP